MQVARLAKMLPSSEGSLPAMASSLSKLMGLGQMKDLDEEPYDLPATEDGDIDLT